MSLDRFPTGEPKHWSADQWAVLDGFRRDYLQGTLEGAGPADNLDDILCMFARGGWPVAELVEQVLAQPDAVLIPRLWRDWCNGCRPSIWMTSFWEGDTGSAAWELWTGDALYGRVCDVALTGSGDLADQALQLASAIESERGGG